MVVDHQLPLLRSSQEFIKKQDAQEKLARTTTKYKILNLKVDQGSLQFDFRIDNGSDLEIKDFMIYCHPADQKGTKLDRRHQIIHEIVPAKSTKTFSNIQWSIGKQARTAQCELIYFFFGEYRVWLKEES